MARTTEEVRAELRVVRGEINDLYWAYTRQARGKPPVLVRPDLYERLKQLQDELRQINVLTKSK